MQGKNLIHNFKEKIKMIILFMYNDYYPYGGPRDIITTFETEEGALEFLADRCYTTTPIYRTGDEELFRIVWDEIYTTDDKSDELYWNQFYIYEDGDVVRDNEDEILDGDVIGGVPIENIQLYCTETKRIIYTYKFD